MPEITRKCSPRLGLVLLCFVAWSCAPQGRPSSHPEASSRTTGAAAPPPAAGAQTRTLPELPTPSEGVAVGIHGAVASAEQNASRAGLEMLKAGGNAVDAAIAIAFALAVTHPSAGNLGGGGFMVIRMADGTSEAIDYRETAPAAATADMYLDASGHGTKASVIGPRAAGIPGTVAGLALAHAHHGTKPWAQLLASAVALAEDGHALDEFHAERQQDAAQRMREAGYADSAKAYLAANGAPLHAGEVWKQPELARTLRMLAEQGPRSFYQGEFATLLARKVQALGGLWTSEDLARYQAMARPTLRFDYLGHEIVTMPPPSAGGIVLRQLLYASELLELRKLPYRDPESLHLFLEAARRAYADRNTWIGDPAFTDVPVTGLIDPDYIRSRMLTIDPNHATPSSSIAAGTPPRESHETTHFSVIDDFGNAVSNTYTLNAGFGALVVVPGTGILLNDEMDDFASNPGQPNLYGLVQGERNKIAPGKRMLSSMTPTIIVKDGQVRAVVGTPGGSAITTTVALLVRALVDYGVPLDVAVRSPRLHHQWLPDQVIIDPDLEPEIARGLRALGHTLVPTPWGHIGHADCVEVDPKTHGFRAVADVTRGGGSSLAY